MPNDDLMSCELMSSVLRTCTEIFMHRKFSLHLHLILCFTEIDEVEIDRFIHAIE